MRHALLLLFLFVSPLAVEAKILRGDWESAGAPVQPYDPSYPFRYQCQMELTDTKWLSQGAEGARKVFAVARFALDNKNLSSPKDLEWKWLQVDEEGREQWLPGSTKFFSTEGHQVRVFPRRGYGEKQDAFLFTLSLHIRLGEYTVVESQSVTAEKGDEAVSKRITKSASGPGNPTLRLFFQCDKKSD